MLPASFCPRKQSDAQAACGTFRPFGWRFERYLSMFPIRIGAAYLYDGSFVGLNSRTTFLNNSAGVKGGKKSALKYDQGILLSTCCIAEALQAPKNTSSSLRIDRYDRLPIVADMWLITSTSSPKRKIWS